MGMRERIEALEKENGSLRERLALDEISPTAETWARHAPQELRDQMAATALINEKLDEPRALIRLGFTLPRNSHGLLPEVWKICERIFATDGVRAILKRDLADAEANKEKLIARLTQTALHGSDADSVRAMQQLAKMGGWNIADRGPNPSTMTLNLMQLFGDRPAVSAATVTNVTPQGDDDGIIDAAVFMDHIPGEATVVIDDPIEALPR